MRNYNILTVDSDSLDFQLTERLWAGQTLYDYIKVYVCHGSGTNLCLIKPKKLVLQYLTHFSIILL